MGLFTTYDDAGRLQLDCDMFTHQLKLKGTAQSVTRTFSNTAVSTIQLRLPGSLQMPLVGVECFYGIAMVSTLRDQSTGEHLWNAACAGPPGTSFNYWVFDTAANIPPNSGLFELYAEDGRVTFSSGAGPMIGLGVVTIGSTAARALPWVPNTLGGQAGFPGRRVCYVQGQHGGHNLYGRWTGYRNGQLLYEEAVPNAVADWYVQIDGKAYGGRVDGSTVYAGGVSMNDVRSYAGNGRQSTLAAGLQDWTVPATGFIVDVTNL